jgi:two-component system OmpR family response regulator
METQPHLLVVDDDSDIRTLLRDYLQEHSYRVSLAADGRQMHALLEQSRIDLVVLDLMLPGEDGLSLCRKLRGQGTLPILMLTARTDPIDRILGLEIGADDYLIKPFEPRELLARIRNILRRTQSQPVSLAPERVARYRFDGWLLEAATHELTSPGGVSISLSVSEYRLLHVFLTHPNRVLTRDQLMDFVKGREQDPFDRSIDLRVSRLRHKLRDDAKSPRLIKTLRNEGYVFAASVTAESD